MSTLATVPASPLAASPDARVVARKTIRVLHLINGEHYAGAERVQDLLALHLPEQGFEAGFVCLKPGRFAEARQSKDAPLAQVPMKSKFDLRCAFRVARIIREGGYAIVHTHTPRTVMIGRLAAALAGVPLVHHVHGQTATEVRRTWKARFNAMVEQMFLAGARKIIAVSQSAGRSLRGAFRRKNKVAVVPNGIPVQPLADRPAPNGTWTLGTVGLFRPRKGIEVLLAALALLRSKGRNVRWLAVGPFETPEYEKQVKAEAVRLGIAGMIEWRGFTKDVHAELARMDLFVFPSVLAEGMPMVLLEAMAAGVPVVASRVDGVTDVIRDGQDGVLCQPGDAHALAEAIDRLLSGLIDWRRLREEAHERQVEEFSAPKMAADVAAVYRDVLAKV
ncbi:MAG: glycosyltransferase [Planctomycetia bacterium]|nr:glycosyltransferase [Planctomycetia bacterium]